MAAMNGVDIFTQILAGIVKVGDDVFDPGVKALSNDLHGQKDEVLILMLRQFRCISSR